MRPFIIATLLAASMPFQVFAAESPNQEDQACSVFLRLFNAIEFIRARHFVDSFETARVISSQTDERLSGKSHRFFEAVEGILKTAATHDFVKTGVISNRYFYRLVLKTVHQLQDLELFISMVREDRAANKQSPYRSVVWDRILAEYAGEREEFYSSLRRFQESHDFSESAFWDALAAFHTEIPGISPVGAVAELKGVLQVMRGIYREGRLRYDVMDEGEKLLELQRKYTAGLDELYVEMEELGKIITESPVDQRPLLASLLTPYALANRIDYERISEFIRAIPIRQRKNLYDARDRIEDFDTKMYFDGWLEKMDRYVEIAKAAYRANVLSAAKMGRTDELKRLLRLRVVEIESIRDVNGQALITLSDLPEIQRVIRWYLLN